MCRWYVDNPLLARVWMRSLLEMHRAAPGQDRSRLLEGGPSNHACRWPSTARARRWETPSRCPPLGRLSASAVRSLLWRVLLAALMLHRLSCEWWSCHKYERAMHFSKDF